MGYRKRYRGKCKTLWHIECEGRFILWGRISDSTNSIKSNKVQGADSAINEFLKYGGSGVRNKLPIFMNMILWLTY